MTSPQWDAEVKPTVTPRFAFGAAAIIIAVHVVVGALLKRSSTGVIFTTADQVAIAALGVVIGGFLCLFARPRLRVGPAGVAVRNLFGYRLVPWRDVRGISFHPGARWARLDLPDDEYIPVMAIQAVDKARAADAMDRVRALVERYRGGSVDGKAGGNVTGNRP
ncbi:PH domain-containing protein [Mycolicibacterium vaccae]|uniref:PH domain-containing protein n=1 Tax=Mycolicibacterium vaccae TaxID=1810 RepID=UPI003D01526B